MLMGLSERTSDRILFNQATGGAIVNWELDGIVTYYLTEHDQTVRFNGPSGKYWSGKAGDVLEAFYGSGFKGVRPKNVMEFFRQLDSYVMSKGE